MDNSDIIQLVREENKQLKDKLSQMEKELNFRQRRLKCKKV